MSQNTRRIRLGELLTGEQLKEVQRICKRDDDVIINDLKAYLKQFKEQLETKGVLPDFLAYYLFFIRKEIAANAI